tara:strand:- start:2900 stop:3214 length:315 start_codon:yes stop_codon:yes gene_type:complete
MVNFFDQCITLVGTFAHIVLLVESLGLPNDNIKRVVKAKPIFLFSFIFLFAKINNAEKYLFVTFLATVVYFFIEYDTIVTTVKNSKPDLEDVEEKIKNKISVMY